jgi:hypothetical protein
VIELQNFQASVIFGSVTIFGILTWYFTPENEWLRQEHVIQALRTADEPATDMQDRND